MRKQKIARQFGLIWGGSTGFVVGAALTALLYRRLGWWPPRDEYLRRFTQQTKQES